MRNYLLASVLVFGLSGFSFANCGNDNGNGNGCSDSNIPGPTGPQGPAGLNGSNGQDGSNGTNGRNGLDGKNGKNGKDSSSAFHGTDLTADIAVRLVDTKYIQVQAYDTYVFGTQEGQDVFGNGHNPTIGTRIVFKLGSSYEERLLEKQANQIKALEALVSRMR